MQTVRKVIDCCPLWLYGLEILVRVFRLLSTPVCIALSSVKVLPGFPRLSPLHHLKRNTHAH